METELVTAPTADKFIPKESTIKVGSGTIVERSKKDGSSSYQAKVRKHGVNVSQTFKTKKEAIEFITKTEAKILTGESVSAVKVRKILLAEIFQDFLNKHPDIAKNKKGRINQLIRDLGKVPLGMFKTSGFQEYINTKLNTEIPDQPRKKKSHKLFNGNRVKNEAGELVKKKYKPGTIRKLYYDIRTILQWHSKMNDYTFDSKPFDDVKAPPAWKKPRTRRLEEGELDKLLKACEQLYKNVEPSKVLIRFLCYSGFRVGETMLIKWKDIKLNEQKPEESYIFIPAENQKIADKEGVEDRYASIRPELYFLIVKEMLPWKKNEEDVVFSFWSSAHYFYTRFKNICYNANIENLTLHDLRHEGGSWFFENTTLSDIEISKITGHIELSTLKRYANLRPHKVGAKLWASLDKKQ